MGVAIPKRRFAPRGATGLARPFVFCCDVGGFIDAAVPVNEAVARQLTEVSPALRSMRLESCLVAALSGLPEHVVIRDFDVLFNPAYRVDVLQVLTSAHRKHPFDAVWPGSHCDGRLVYAEEGFDDYRTYDIARYDVTCIY